MIPFRFVFPCAALAVLPHFAAAQGTPVPSIPTRPQLDAGWIVVQTSGADTTWLDSTRVDRLGNGKADVWLFLDNARGRMVNHHRLDCNKVQLEGFLSTTWFGPGGAVMYNEKFDSVHVIPKVTEGSTLLAMRACRLLRL